MTVACGEELADHIRDVASNGLDAVIDTAGTDEALDAGRGSLPALVKLTGGPEHKISRADPAAAAMGVRFASGEPDDVFAILAE